MIPIFNNLYSFKYLTDWILTWASEAIKITINYLEVSNTPMRPYENNYSIYVGP